MRVHWDWTVISGESMDVNIHREGFEDRSGDLGGWSLLQDWVVAVIDELATHGFGIFDVAEGSQLYAK